MERLIDAAVNGSPFAIEARPPSALSAQREYEQAVLGRWLERGVDIPAAWRVPAADFGETDHAMIADAIEACARRGTVDVLAVFAELAKRGQADEAGGLAYLNSLVTSSTLLSTTRTEAHAAEVRKRARERRQSQLRTQIAALAKGSIPTDEFTSELSRLVAELDDDPGRATPNRFPLLRAEGLRALPRAVQRINGVLPESGCAAVFGPSGSGKSFVVLGMVAAIAEGTPWFGHRVRQGRCVYVGLEGQAGTPRRVAAWEEHHGRAFPDDVQFMLERFCITDPADVRGLISAVTAAGGTDVVVIDTLNRAAPSADENSSQDMGAILEGEREIRAGTGALVIFVHHSGKDSTRGMRGHSSLFAALDAAIEVARVDERREWRICKSKDGEDGGTHPFELRVVDLGEDDDGERVTSCVAIEPQQHEDGPQTPRTRPPKGGNQRIVFDALGPLLASSSEFGRGGAPAMRPCITLDAAIEGTRGRLAVEPKRHGERARGAITGLIASGVLCSGEGWLWLR